jgi:hypothetical protein
MYDPVQDLTSHNPASLRRQAQIHTLCSGISPYGLCKGYRRSPLDPFVSSSSVTILAHIRSLNINQGNYSVKGLTQLSLDKSRVH